MFCIPIGGDKQAPEIARGDRRQRLSATKNCATCESIAIGDRNNIGRFTNPSMDNAQNLLN